MSEREVEVKTFSCAYICDTCGKGEMRPTGMVLTSWPAQYPHRCTVCDAAKTFQVSYPRLVYKVVGEEAQT